MKDAERWQPLGVALWFIAVIFGFCLATNFLPSHGG